MCYHPKVFGAGNYSKVPPMITTQGGHHDEDGDDDDEMPNTQAIRDRSAAEINWRAVQIRDPDRRK